MITTAEGVSAWLDAGLRTIRITDNDGEPLVDTKFETDIGRTVFRGKRKIENLDVPCAVLHEGDDSVLEHATGRIAKVKLGQRYILGGYAICDADNPNDMALTIIRDLKRMIFGSGKRDLNGQVYDVRYFGRAVGPRSDGSNIVFAIIEVEVEFVEDLTIPS